MKTGLKMFAFRQVTYKLHSVSSFLQLIRIHEFIFRLKKIFVNVKFRLFILNQINYNKEIIEKDWRNRWIEKKK